MDTNFYIIVWLPNDQWFETQIGHEVTKTVIVFLVADQLNNVL